MPPPLSATQFFARVAIKRASLDRCRHCGRRYRRRRVRMSVAVTWLDPCDVTASKCFRLDIFVTGSIIHLYAHAVVDRWATVSTVLIERHAVSWSIEARKKVDVIDGRSGTERYDISLMWFSGYTVLLSVNYWAYKLGIKMKLWACVFLCPQLFERRDSVTTVSCLLSLFLQIINKLLIDQFQIIAEFVVCVPDSGVECLCTVVIRLNCDFYLLVLCASYVCVYVTRDFIVSVVWQFTGSDVGDKCLQDDVVKCNAMCDVGLCSAHIPSCVHGTLCLLIKFQF